MELAPGILQPNGCMTKNRRNLTDRAGVTTQPVAPLPETKDGRGTGETMLAKTSSSPRQAAAAITYHIRQVISGFQHGGASHLSSFRKTGFRLLGSCLQSEDNQSG